MTSPAIKPGGPPQGIFEKVISALKKVGHWLGRRKVYEVNPQRQPGLQAPTGHGRHSGSALSSRMAQPALQQYTASMRTGGLHADLSVCLMNIEATEARSNRLLSQCPVEANTIQSVVKACGQQQLQLESLLRELTAGIASSAEAVPTETVPVETISAATIPAATMAAALEKQQQLQDTLLALENRRALLEQRLTNHPSSLYYLIKAQLGHYRAATDAVAQSLETVPEGANRQKQEELLQQLLDKQDELQQRLSTASRSDGVGATAIAHLKRLPGRLVRTLQKNGVGVDMLSHKHTLAHIANLETWEVSRNPIQFQYQGCYHRFSETVIPASQMKLTPEHLPDDFQEAGASASLFREPYASAGISSHSTQEVRHAVNLNCSRLEDDQGEVVFQCVRHAVHSPYGLPAGSQERRDGALRRAEESAVAALHLYPDKMKAALAGEPVELVLTSSSLLTPDVFRQAVGNSEKDEHAMLQDQVTAWQQLNQQKTLPVRLPSGEVRHLPVKIRVVPFNFGMNKFSLGKTAALTGGWGPSDRLNKMGLETLVGPLIGGSSVHGGLVGEHIARLQRESPGHPDIQLIGELVEQVRHIYNNRQHHNTQGGAAKLVSRVMVLTHMIGGTPLVNCKSAKDRTALAVTDAEWLVTRMRLTGSVPNPDAISPADQRLFMELALQGNHLNIQLMNSGAPGFKIDDSILAAYVDEPEMRAYLGGLAGAVLA